MSIARCVQAEAEHLLDYVASTNGAAFNPVHVLEFSTLNVMMDLMFSERLEFDSQTEIFIRKLASEILESISVIFQVFPALLHLPFFRRSVAEWRRQSILCNSFLERKVCGRHLGFIVRRSGCTRFVTVRYVT